jgi:hypothetical protein
MAWKPDILKNEFTSYREYDRVIRYFHPGEGIQMNIICVSSLLFYVSTMNIDYLFTSWCFGNLGYFQSIPLPHLVKPYVNDEIIFFLSFSQNLDFLSISIEAYSHDRPNKIDLQKNRSTN